MDVFKGGQFYSPCITFEFMLLEVSPCKNTRLDVNIIFSISELPCLLQSAIFPCFKQGERVLILAVPTFYRPR